MEITKNRKNSKEISGGKTMKAIQELSCQQIATIIAVINAIICILLVLAGIIIGTWIEKNKQRNFRKKMLLIKRKISQSLAPKKTYVVKDKSDNVDKRPIIEQLNEAYGKPYKDSKKNKPKEQKGVLPSDGRGA